MKIELSKQPGVPTSVQNKNSHFSTVSLTRSAILQTRKITKQREKSSLSKLICILKCLEKFSNEAQNLHEE